MYKKGISQQVNAKNTIEYVINDLTSSYNDTGIKGIVAILQHAGLKTHILFNQSDFAHSLGVRREAGNRITNNYDRDGWVTKVNRGFKKRCLYIINPILQNPAVKSALIRYVRGLKSLQLAYLMADRTLLNIKGEGDARTTKLWRDFIRTVNLYWAAKREEYAQRFDRADGSPSAIPIYLQNNSSGQFDEYVPEDTSTHHQYCICCSEPVAWPEFL